jgi:hypothetical protein
MSALVQGALLLIISLVAIAEGLRLVINKEPNTLYDPLGPGWYAVAVGFGLMVVGVVFLIANYGNPSAEEAAPVDKKLRTKLVSTIAACVIYVALIGIVGYLLATIFFFFMQFRIEQIRSWALVVVLSLVLSGLYYVLFIRYCNMIFPKGIIFG